MGVRRRRRHKTNSNSGSKNNSTKMDRPSRSQPRAGAKIPIWAYFALFGAAFVIILTVAVSLRTELNAEDSSNSTGHGGPDQGKHDGSGAGGGASPAPTTPLSAASTATSASTSRSAASSSSATSSAATSSSAPATPQPSLCPSITDSSSSSDGYTRPPALQDFPPIDLRIVSSGQTVKLEVLGRVPHNPTSFLQGLEFHDCTFYETTGMRGRSKLMRIVPGNATVLQSYSLSRPYFGEGLTVWDDKIYWITWQSNKGFIFDRDSFDLLGDFSYPTEGWGLAHDDTRFIMTDGSAYIFYRDRDTFAELFKIRVVSNGNPITYLNEIELIDGYLYVNVWQHQRIAIFKLPTSPQPTVEVEAWLDMRTIHNNLENGHNFVNGVAFDPATRTLYCTGKEWRHIYEIEMPDHALFQVS